MIDMFVFYLLSLTHEPRHGKTTICICENKDADQLRGYREADLHLCLYNTSVPKVQDF